jgi:hypothetical protein
MQLCEHLRTVWTTDPPLLIDILAISKIAPRGFHHRLRNTHLAHGLKSLALAPVLNRLRPTSQRQTIFGKDGTVPEGAAFAVHGGEQYREVNAILRSESFPTDSC